MKTHLCLCALGAMFLTACGGPSTPPADAPTQAPVAAPVSSADADATVADSTAAVDAFMAYIAAHCGQAFAGSIVANEPANPDDPFAGKALVMHVRECGPEQLKVPFHVGDDHSRTWVLTRTESGLRLKHDHRHEDGTDDAVTMYGGDTADSGSAQRQEFPVDQESRELFEREGLNVSVTNTWAMEIEPGQRFVYELSRPGRLFKVEFDLTQPVAVPPDPWGHPPIE